MCKRGAVISVLIVFLLAAPGAEAETLRLATHWTGQEKVLLDGILQVYEDEHPGVEIVSTTWTFDEYLSRLLVSYAAAVAPDVLHVYDQWTYDLVAEGVLAPLPESMRAYVRDNYLPPAVDGATVDGVLHGIPTEINGYQIVYNGPQLASAGYGSPPDTWRRLVQAARRLTLREAGETVRAGLAFPTGWPEVVYHPYLAMLYNDGGQMFSPDGSEALVDMGAATRALQRQVRVHAEGVIDPARSAWDFPNGDVSMVFMANWYESQLRRAMGPAFQDVRAAPLPQGDAGQTTVSYGWQWGVSAASKHQEAAWDLLAWLNVARPVQGSHMGSFLVALGALPSQRGDIARHGEALFDDFTGPFVAALGTAKPVPKVRAHGRIAGVMEQAIIGAWNREEAVVEALDGAKRAIDAILTERRG